jgi:hypothetical protein
VIDPSIAHGSQVKQGTRALKVLLRAVIVAIDVEIWDRLIG